MAYDVPNCSVDEPTRETDPRTGKPKYRELRSSRGPGLYQIGSGSRHPSGDIYRSNGKTPIVLTAAETAIWAEFLGYKPVPKSAQRRIFNNLLNLPDDQSRALENLNRISPDCCYKDWQRAGRALYGVFGDRGYAMWDQWSAGSTKYPEPDKTLAKWNTFERSTLLNGRVLTAIANEHDPAGKRRVV